MDVGYPFTGTKNNLPHTQRTYNYGTIATETGNPRSTTQSYNAKFLVWLITLQGKKHGVPYNASNIVTQVVRCHFQSLSRAFLPHMQDESPFLQRKSLALGQGGASSRRATGTPGEVSKHMTTYTYTPGNAHLFISLPCLQLIGPTATL